MKIVFVSILTFYRSKVIAFAIYTQMYINKSMRKIFSLLVLFILASFFIGIVPKAYAAAPDAANSSIAETSPGSGSAYADGSATVRITVTLQDNVPTPLAGDTISLATPTDGSAIFSPATAVLNGSGQAQFTVRSTHVGTPSVNVTDVTQGVTLTALGTINFEVVPSATPNPNAPTTCSSVAPQAPDFYSLKEGSSSATLYFTPPPSAYNSFTISYGISPSADSHSVKLNQSSSTGAISYKINDLTNGANYFFKVQAFNGCAPSPWSQTKSFRPLTLPVTGPEQAWMWGFMGLIIAGFGTVLTVRSR